MNEQRLLERFLRYVTCDSESGDEREFCLLLEKELTELGLTVWRDEVGERAGSNGWNVQASLPGEGEPILFSCHLDTVYPGKGIRPIVENGVIRSGGDTVLGADDKSGIAAVMEALAYYIEQKLPHRPVEIMFSVCEELGLRGAKYADYSRFASKEAIVLDSSKYGSIVNRAPANVRLQVEIKGKSAHAGISPDKGAHALKAAAEAIAHIPCGFVDDNTVMNVANFLAPGKTNVVPGEAKFEMEIRSFEEEALSARLQAVEEALKAACARYQTSYTLTVDRHSDRLHVPADSPLTKRLVQAYASIGMEVTIDRTYGGCDATWLFANGINALNIATGMTDAHSVSEYIAVEHLNGTCKIVQYMMKAHE